MKNAEINIETFFSESTELLCVTELDGGFVRFNKSWKVKLGYSPESLEGENFFKLVHPDDLAGTQESVNGLKNNDSSLNFRIRFKVSDGSYTNIEWKAIINDRLLYLFGYDITDQQDRKQKITQLDNAVEYSPATVVITDTDGHITYANKKFESLTGYNREEVLGENPRFLKSGEMDDAFYEELWKTISSGKSWRGLFHNKRKDGTLFWESARISPVFDENGEITDYVAIKEDITDQKAAEEELRESRELLDMFFRQSLDGFFFMMLDAPVDWGDKINKEKVLDYAFEHQRITRINKAMLQQYKAEESDFLGFTPKDFFEHDIEQGKKTWRKLFDDGKLHIDTEEQRFDGSSMIVEGDYICIYDQKGRIKGHFGIQRDVTFERRAKQELEESEKRLREAAIRDPLTGLYNRRYIFDRLDSLIEKTKRDRNPFSVAMIDIDHFKEINDKYGHITGDIVLKNFSDIMNSNIRKYDILGRFGGEEFIIIFLNTERAEAKTLVERILENVRNTPLEHDGNVISYTFSAGISNFTDCSPQKCTVEGLIAEADSSLYSAKSLGRNRVVS